MPTFNSANNAVATGFPSSVTVSLNNAAGDGLWACAFQRNTSGSIDSITYNSVSLTFDAHQTTTRRARSGYLAAPATGANNLTANVTAGTSASAIIVGQTYTNVDQTSVITAAGTAATANNTDATWTQTTANGDMLVSAACIDTAAFHTVTAQGGATKRTEGTNDTHRFGLDEAATSSSQVINATWSVSDRWWGCSGSLKAAAAGGAVRRPSRLALLGVS